MRDGRPRREARPDDGRVRLGHQPQRASREKRERGQLPWHGGFQDPERTAGTGGQFGGACRDLMHSHVVAVAIAAVPVVAEQQGGLFRCDQGGQPGRGLLRVGAGEPHLAGRVGESSGPCPLSA